MSFKYPRATKSQDAYKERYDIFNAKLYELKEKASKHEGSWGDIADINYYIKKLDEALGNEE